jgi:hypothetical protein
MGSFTGKTTVHITSLEYGEAFWESHPFAVAFTTRSLAESLRQGNRNMVFVVPHGYKTRAEEDIAHLRALQTPTTASTVQVFETNGASLGALSAQMLADPALTTALQGTVLAAKEGGQKIKIAFFAPSERSHGIATLLGAPSDASGVELSALWGSKSKSRETFKEASVPHPEGFYHVHTTLSEVRASLALLLENTPSSVRAVAKMNDASYTAGDGFVHINMAALRALPSEVIRGERSLTASELENPSVKEGWRSLQSFEESLASRIHEGVVIEDWRTDVNTTFSPSGQGFIRADRDVKVRSTHVQILGGEEKTSYQGAVYPAPAGAHEKIAEEIQKVGAYLSAQGYRGPFGVDFIVTHTGEILATEINARRLGTTHPYTLAKQLTGTSRDSRTQQLTYADGAKVYYVNQWLRDDSIKSLSAEEAYATLRSAGLLWDAEKREGVALQISAGLPEGFVEITALATNPEKAQVLQAQAREALLKRSKLT